MRALVYAPDAPQGIVLADAPEPVPGRSQALVRASLRPTSIDFQLAQMRGAGTRIEAFAVGARFGPDLSFLLGLVAAGELDPQVGWRGPWEKVVVAAEALLGRQVRGKAVLDVSP